MNITVTRIRPTDQFRMPEKIGPRRGVLYLSRPIMVRGGGTGMATTNVGLKLPMGYCAIFLPIQDLLRRHGLIATPFTSECKDGAEITIPVFNASDTSIPVKPNTELLEFLIIPAADDAEFSFRS